MKRKPVVISALAIIHTAVCILSGALGWYPQFLIVQNAGITALLVLHLSYGVTPISASIVVLPFYCLYTPLSIYFDSYPTFPIWMTGILTIIIAYWMFRSSRFVFPATCLVFLQVFGFVFIMPNNFAYLSMKVNPSRFVVQQAVMITQENQPFNPLESRGKVILFDIWHSACGVCIRGFPKLQSLQEQFKKDTSVVIYSLNIPLDSSDRPVSDSLTELYTFHKIYFKNRQEARKLSVPAVPLVLIVDKNGVCRYAGGLNTDWNVFIGNAKTIINKLKHES